MVITGLYIYPIKSLKGFSVQATKLSATGFEHDRRWMLVDPQNRFISQREHPELCLFDVQPDAHGFNISLNGASFHVPHSLQDGQRKWVRIWDDEVVSVEFTAGSAWFSQQLGRDVALVYLPDDASRLVDTTYAFKGEVVSFADGFPVLCIGEASMNLLQSKVTEPMSIERFRPNLVFSGGTPHCEDTWKEVQIGSVLMVGAKPCGRCQITTIDQQSGKAGKEPLRTLATYRQWNQKIIFGENMLIPSAGYVQVGDPIEVLSHKEPALLHT